MHGRCSLFREILNQSTLQCMMIRLIAHGRQNLQGLPQNSLSRPQRTHRRTYSSYIPIHARRQQKLVRAATAQPVMLSLQTHPEKRQQSQSRISMHRLLVLIPRCPNRSPRHRKKLPPQGSRQSRL